MEETSKPFFKWDYALGTSIRGKRHTVYKDWEKKVQKEVHPGNDVSYWADDCKTPFETEDQLKEYILNRDKDKPTMEEKQFQIRLCNAKGHGSFLYFKSTDEGAKEVACKTANEYLETTREKDKHDIRPFHNAYKAFKTVHVVEYDSTNHIPKKGGTKFKLSLRFIKIKTAAGTQVTNDWYEAD